MLNKKHRLNRGEDFRRVLSRGKKMRTDVGLIAVSAGGAPQPRFGFIVSKAVGTAVVRNRVKRNLRAAAAMVLDGCPHVDVVVRSQPGAEQTSVAKAASLLREAVHR